MKLKLGNLKEGKRERRRRRRILFDGKVSWIERGKERADLISYEREL